MMCWHYNDVIMSAMASQIPSLTNGLLNRLFKAQIKKNTKARVTGLCEGISLVTGEFPAQRASNAENVPIWWRHPGTTSGAISDDKVGTMTTPGVQCITTATPPELENTWRCLIYKASRCNKFCMMHVGLSQPMIYTWLHNRCHVC